MAENTKTIEKKDEIQEIFDIPEVNYSWLKFKIEELNKKAAKVKCSPIIFEIIEKYVAEKETVVNGRFTVNMIKVKVVGEAPKFSGWTFIATIQHLAAGNVLRTIGNVEIPTKYRDVKPICDHCGHIRKRKDTYLVQNDSGEIKQVGKSCIKDFLGHVDPKKLAWMANWIDSLLAEMADKEELTKFNSNSAALPRDTFLDYVAASIQKDGWVAKSSYSGIPTSSKASFQLLFPSKVEKKDKIETTKESWELVQKTLKWVKELKKQGNLNDYMHNLVISLSEDFISHRLLGIAASAVSSYLKQVEKKKLYEENKKRGKDSEYVGNIKERLDFEAELLSIRSFETDFGTTYLYTFNSKGNVLVWFSSSNKDLSVGTTYKFKGTVKKHQTYKEVKQTVLTRCKIANENK